MATEMRGDLLKSLELAFVLMSSESHVNEFISNKGMERIYSILRDGEVDSIKFEDNYNENHRLPTDSSTKLKALELLNAILNFKTGADHFLNYCLISSDH